MEIFLDSPAIVLATVMERPYPSASEIKRHADVVILKLTVENRNDLPAAIASMIRKEFEEDR